MQKTKNDEQAGKGKTTAVNQTDLAEGELDTVEESIRIHEQKGDAQGKPPSKTDGKKANK